MLQLSTFLTIYILTVVGIFGAIFGSFINCMAWRIAHNENAIKGRSHCTKCGHTLGAVELIPIFSYIFLKGKCRHCREKISPRYVAIEILSAAAFMLTIYTLDVSFDALRIIVLLCILLSLSLVDLEIYEIPDRFILSGIIWWAVTVPLLETPWQEQLKEGLIGGFAIGGGMLLMAILFDKITGKESLGGGDIKLFFMTGLYMGPWVSLFCLILACLFGIGFVLVMGQKKIPFGPAISAAVFVSVLVGDNIVNWYLSLF